LGRPIHKSPFIASRVKSPQGIPKAATNSNSTQKPLAASNTLGFEATLWAAAKLRGHMDAAEYKHVVLGLIFLITRMVEEV
jgi:type I restriction enzyme M protein